MLGAKWADIQLLGLRQHESFLLIQDGFNHQMDPGTNFLASIWKWRRVDKQDQPLKMATTQQKAKTGFFKIFQFRPKLFQLFRVFLNSDFCKFWDLFAAQLIFCEMFLIAFNKIFPTFGYFFLTILSHFHKMWQLFWFEKQLAASQFFWTLLAYRSAAAK